MTETIITHQANWSWIDITNPSKKDLTQLAKEHGLHPHLVKDCLDPEHLPKYEKHSNVHFLILRAFDENCSTEADEVLEITRKIALFISDKFLITVHRKDQNFLSRIKSEYKEKNQDKAQIFTMNSIVSEIMIQTIQSYERPIDNAFNELEKIEGQVVSLSQLDSNILKKGYYLKRRASVFKRMFRMSSDVLSRAHFIMTEDQNVNIQDIKENLESSFFYVDQLLDDTNNLLNLHISVSSQRTNEVMRILTVFSLFFLPLNFIASIYGMNFEFMPELKLVNGYYYVLFIMGLVAVTIFIWFKRKKWL